MTAIEISGRRIGQDAPPYIVAEVSANHNGSLETALKIVDAAVDAGADAIKLQTYKPDTITMQSDRPEFRIDSGLWEGQTLYELYEWAHMPWEWHAPIFAHAAKRGITCFSSPFDDTAVDLLESLGAPAYKIASFEAVDLPLIRRVAETGKPMIISTGMADQDEIAEAVAAARNAGCSELVLLHCVSGYPAPAEDYNLATIPDMAARFGCGVGLSDHTIENTTAVAAVALGAVLVEKHVTLDRSGGGPDDSFSLEPDGLRELVTGARTAWQARGMVNYARKRSEQSNLQFRRSIYFARDLQAGDVVRPGDVKTIRPGHGVAPKHLDDVIGKRVLRSVDRASPVRLEDLEG